MFGDQDGDDDRRDRDPRERGDVFGEAVRLLSDPGGARVPEPGVQRIGRGDISLRFQRGNEILIKEDDDVTLCDRHS